MLILFLITQLTFCNAFQFQFPLSNVNTNKPNQTIEINNNYLSLMDLNQYKDEKIIRINSNDFSNIRNFIENISIWESNNEFTDIQISKNLLSNLNLNYSIIINDLSKSIQQTFPKDEFNIFDQNFNILNDIFFKEFRSLNTIYSWLDIIKETFPDLVDIEWLGSTYEGRDMKALHIHSSNSGLNKDKKTILITGGIHAREWISVSTCLYTIYQLLTRYGKNPKDTFYLNNLDFLIIPVFNPDGYDYTWTNDRLWRKNRQETYLPRCFGIDIDHSFGYHFNNHKTDSYPCGESYSGEVEFEAIEALNLHNYINITKNDHIIYGFLDFHSYTQKILYPYAYSCDELPRDLENLVELAYGLSKSIRSTHGKLYQVLPACKDRGVDLFPGLGSGSSLDYMYHNRAHWAFQLKLRDTGSHGFLLPSNYIKPVGKEIYKAVGHFCQFILNPDLP